MAAQKSTHTYDAPLLFLSYKSCILLVSIDRCLSRTWPAVDRYAAARDSFVPLKNWELQQALEPLTCARKDTMAEDAGGLDLWCFLMDVVRYPISNVVWIIRKELYTYRSHLESLVPNVLGTFQSARNLGHWKMSPFKSKISTGIRGTFKRIYSAFTRYFWHCLSSMLH
jgi:hypothetical protein